ncbi:MAG: hypothetical protein ACR2JO_12450 [Mycobacteriales bacterium]
MQIVVPYRNDEAATAYDAAARLTTSIPGQRYLNSKAALLNR